MLRTIVVVRVLAAFLGFSALVTEVATLVNEHRFDAGDFFGCFTVEPDTLAVLSRVASSFALVGGREVRGLHFFREAVTLFMTTTICSSHPTVRWSTAERSPGSLSR